MARKRIKRRRKKSKKKIQSNSAHASLCALALVITDKQILETIHEKVQIPQKEVFYRPTDKLVFVVLGVLSGCEAVFDLNQNLRVDRPLLRAFGYQKCAGYKDSVLVTTDMKADIHTTVSDYDGRSGVPESSFCQDNQGLGMRKRRKRSFVAQQMLTLLNQLAHNLIRWMQEWLMTAVEDSAVEQSAAKSPSWDDESEHSSDYAPVGVSPVVKTLNGFGMKRFVRQILSLSGRVVMKKGKVLQVILNPLYPLINRIKTAFVALLKSYGIAISLDEI